jgi:3-oxoacyl-(acyl-carrier-protein) synthase
MNHVSVLAASCLGAQGYGNDRTGWRAWPGPVAEAMERGEWEALRWSTLFTSGLPRFGRMDMLSRLGLMAVELLDAGFAQLTPAERDAVGVCVETGSGSLATDWNFLRMPLASTFAYTLPSTVVGEICIRHGFRGPVMCLCRGRGQAGALATARRWLERGDAGACVCVACDFVHKEVAALLPLPDDMPPGGWQGRAVWLGKEGGQGRPDPWRSGSLAGLAQALVAGPEGPGRDASR